jgi:hypothetical protein
MHNQIPRTHVYYVHSWLPRLHGSARRLYRSSPANDGTDQLDILDHFCPSYRVYLCDYPLYQSSIANMAVSAAQASFINASRFAVIGRVMTDPSRWDNKVSQRAWHFGMG